MELNELNVKLSEVLAEVQGFDERQIVKNDVKTYVWGLNHVQTMPILQRLTYWKCCFIVFEYLHKAGQLKRDKVGFDCDVMMPLLEEIDKSLPPSPLPSRRGSGAQGEKGERGRFAQN